MVGIDFEQDELGLPDEAMWTSHQRTPKTVAKQRDKEVAWNDIPDSEKKLYVQAEKKQWSTRYAFSRRRRARRW